MNAIGTVVELRPNEGLGWIESDDGKRVLFGGTACKGFVVEVGSRVRVLGMTMSASGKLKAKRLELLDSPEAPPALCPAAPAEITWEDFVAAHPTWSDAAERVMRPSLSAPQIALERHSWFEPWHEEIHASFAVMQNIDVPSYRAPKPFKPRARDSFAFGHVVFLEHEDWPTCGSCRVPLEVCVQLAPDVIGPWMPRDKGRGLVAMYCFRCMPRGGFVDEVPSVCIELVTPRHELRLENPPTSKSAGGPHTAESQRLGFELVRNPPTTMWYRYRSEHVSHTASAGLFGYDAASIAGVDDMEEFIDVYEAWVPGRFSGDYLGGLPAWDQADATPACGIHGQMLQLLDWSGEDQFLDGALHVFVCREPTCQRLAFVAEF